MQFYVMRLKAVYQSEGTCSLPLNCLQFKLPNNYSNYTKFKLLNI